MTDIARMALSARRPDVTRRASATSCPPCGSELGHCKETKLDLVGAARLRTIDAHMVYVVNACMGTCRVALLRCFRVRVLTDCYCCKAVHSIGSSRLYRVAMHDWLSLYVSACSIATARVKFPGQSLLVSVSVKLRKQYLAIGRAPASMPLGAPRQWRRDPRWRRRLVRHWLRQRLTPSHAPSAAAQQLAGLRWTPR